MGVLSVVAASRNDGHGLNLLPRTQVFIDGLADQVERFGREVELILVDWNPPPDRPPLADVLNVRPVSGFTARVITVPPAVHDRMSMAANLSFFQMIAKNVGIRRAEGNAVLATNIDIVLSDDLFLAATAEISRRRVYRADRVDVAFDPAVCVDPQILRQSSAIRIHRKTGVYYPGVGEVQHYVRGGGSLARVAIKDPVDFMRRLLRSANLDRYRRAFISILELPQLHLNACGDFTLMARDSWAELRGYPEWEIFSWNMDSILLYQAAAAGFAFEELRYPAFHLEHSAGWSLESQDELFGRLRKQGIPVLTDVDALDVAHAIWKGRKNGRWRTNLDGWGLRDRDLVETGLAEAARPRRRLS